MLQAVPIAQVLDEKTILLSVESQHVFSPEFHSGPLREIEATQYLTVHEWPIALQSTFLKNLQKLPLRFIIVDDSGM